MYIQIQAIAGWKTKIKNKAFGMSSRQIFNFGKTGVSPASCSNLWTGDIVCKQVAMQKTRKVTSNDQWKRDGVMGMFCIHSMEITFVKFEV